MRLLLTTMLVCAFSVGGYATTNDDELTEVTILSSMKRHAEEGNLAMVQVLHGVLHERAATSELPGDCWLLMGAQVHRMLWIAEWNKDIIANGGEPVKING